MNLSISDFQKISNGSHNAGDITLTSSGKLDKVNNHVGILKGWNNKTISATTTLEVKNAFVKALKNAGVTEASLADVREELGLSRSGSTKGLDLSKLKPLTRAQTREILDRFAATINEKAQRTVVSNRWEALKSTNIEGYNNLLARAAAVNQKTAETLAAPQKKLGTDILTNGAGSIPAKIRNSTAYNSLSEVNKEKFTKIFTAMLFHGGADVDSIAADALKKTLISSYGKGIQNDAQRNLFKGLALNCPATTDLAKILEDIKAAKKTATSEKGVKLEFGSNSKEMDELAYVLRTVGGLGLNVNNAAAKSKSSNFAMNIAKEISENDTFLKEVVAKFGGNVKDLGSLELDGKPNFKITNLPNGKAQIDFDIKASIGRNKAFTGHCFLKLVVDLGEKALQEATCELKLKPSKFTAKDEKPIELHKMKVIDNVKYYAQCRGVEMTDDDVVSIMDQMSKWEDMGPGQLKKFEEWSKNAINDYINECISGEAEKMANRSPIKFDENGLASQFSSDGNRATFKIGNNLFDMSKPGANAADLIKKLCDSLPDKTDRKFVSGLMNQSTVANIAVLVANAADPAKYDEVDPPSLRSMDAAGEHVANFVTGQSPILISQPTDLADSRYELKFDTNDKSKATLTVSSNYRIIASNELCEGELISPGNADPHQQYSSFGKVGFSYQISITGLGTGNPQIASVGFTQEMMARDVQGAG